jgi:tripartite-type tricarboxylate transporter receptor subunit TctC
MASVVRSIVSLALVAVLIGVSVGEPAFAAFPERIIRIVVPQAPGGGTDAIARVLAQEMAKDLGGSVIVENKAGAGTIVGTQAVVSSEADGYTLLMGTFASAVNSSLIAKLPYDVHRDLAPVALIARAFNIVVVNPKSPLRSISDLVATAKAEPGKISFGTYGTGTSAHLGGELFKSLAGVKMTAVPYKGSAPAITDLLGGQIDLLWDQVTNAITQVQSGALHGIAVTSPQRLEQLKDVPTTAELGIPEVSYKMWHGLYVAKGTPKEIVVELNGALRKALAEPSILAKLKDLGTLPFPEAEMSPEAHAKLFADDLPRIAKLIESSGMKPTEAK